MIAGMEHEASRNVATFQEDGVLALPGVVSEGEVTILKGRFWHEIGQSFEISEHETATWLANPHNPAGDSRGRRLTGMNPVMESLRRTEALAPAQAAVRDVIDAIFGPGRWEPMHMWYSLLSFPGGDLAWTIPQDSWHNDEPIVVGDREPLSIFAFVFLDRVERETGPTLAITGSHRRGQVIASERGVVDERQVQAFDRGLHLDPGTVRILPVGQLLPELTATDEWFEDLVGHDDGAEREQRFVVDGTKHGDIESRVVELVGDAGDVVLLDPRCLHTFSANISKRPRQILRLDFRRTACAQT